MLATCPVGGRPMQAYHAGISLRKQPARVGRWMQESAYSEP
jgi:hypothetical protein